MVRYHLCGVPCNAGTSCTLMRQKLRRGRWDWPPLHRGFTSVIMGLSRGCTDVADGKGSEMTELRKLGC